MDRDLLLQCLLEDKDAKKVLYLLEVVKKLLMKYWKKLMMPEFICGLQKINKDVADVIYLLDGVHLLNERDLSRFIRDYKARLSEQQLDFILKSNDRNVVKPLKTFLEKQFGGDATLEFEEIPYDDLTVHMRGHGYSFRRSLGSDIDKLLA